MPCDDITENLRLTLDGENQLTSYSLSKKTCGGAVGLDSILLDYLGGQPVDKIIGNEQASLLPEQTTEDEIEMYFKLKHFFALQSVLKVYLGKASGGAGDSCAIVAIEHDGGNTIIDAEIRIDLLTDQIEACGRCGPRCRSASPRAASK
jgi:hypothetical protein